MKRVILGAMFGMAALVTTVFAGTIPVGERPGKAPGGDIRLVDLNFNMRFAWAGKWIWANGQPSTSASYEWLRIPSAKYCSNNYCREVTRTTNPKTSTETFRLDGALYELIRQKDGSLYGRFWGKGSNQGGTFPPDATATFYPDKTKQAAAPANNGNLKWVGPWSWSRPLMIFGKPSNTSGERVSVERLQNNQVNLCMDLGKPATCKVVPYTRQNEAYIITAAGGYYEVRLNNDSLFGMFWWDPKKRAQTTPDGTFSARQVK